MSARPTASNDATPTHDTTGNTKRKSGSSHRSPQESSVSVIKKQQTTKTIKTKQLTLHPASSPKLTPSRAQDTTPTGMTRAIKQEKLESKEFAIDDDELYSNKNYPSPSKPTQTSESQQKPHSSPSKSGRQGRGHANSGRGRGRGRQNSSPKAATTSTNTVTTQPQQDPPTQNDQKQQQLTQSASTPSSGNNLNKDFDQELKKAGLPGSLATVQEEDNIM